MTLLLDAPNENVVGRQEPRVVSFPDSAVFSSGPEVVDFAALAGLVMDPWQEIALDVIFKEQADGKWAAREVGYLVGRQNGKGGILSAVCLAALFLFDDVKEILFSAHEFKTAKKAYRDLKGLIEGTPALHALVQRRGSRVVGFRQSNEDTSITLQDGTVLRFMARSNNTGRGFSPQLVIADEAQECTQDTRSALFYTIRAQVNPLVIWCGTVPGKKNNGEVFKALRNRGRKGGDSAMSWLEWTPDPRTVDPMSVDAIVDSTPGMGYRITLETVLAERLAAVENDEAWESFMLEALSIWPDDADTAVWGVVTKEAWGECLTGENERKAAKPGWLTGPVALAVEMDQSHTHSYIAAAGACREGGIGVDIMEAGEGMGWVLNRLLALTSDPDRPISHVVIDPRSPATSLIAPLTDDGITVTEPTTNDVVKATGYLIDTVNEAAIVHRGSPELDGGAAVAVLRKAGEAQVIDRWANPKAVPFIAANLAVWGHLQPVEAPAEADFLVI